MTSGCAVGVERKTLQVSSAYLKEQKKKKISDNRHPEINDRRDMSDFRVVSAAGALCGPHACQHNFRLLIALNHLLFQKFLVLLESPDRHCLLFAVTPVSNWSALNAPKCLDMPAISDST